MDKLKGKIRLSDISQDELDSLTEMFTSKVIPAAAIRAYSKIGGVKNSQNLELIDLISDLTEKYLLVIRKLKADEDKGKRKKPYGVFGYVNNSVFNASRAYVTDFYGKEAEVGRIRDKYIDDTVSSQFDSIDALTKDPPVEAKVKNTINIIKGIAGKLGIKVTDDWVDTIIKCGRVNNLEKHLNDSEIGVLNVYIDSLRTNGYIVAEGKPTSHGVVRKVAKKMVLADPDVSADQIRRELTSMGIMVSANVAVATLGEVRKLTGVKTNRRVYSGTLVISKTCQEIWEEGITEIDDMKAELKRRGVVFKPRMVYDYHRNLEKYGTINRMKQ